MIAGREAKLAEVTFGFILWSPAGAATTLTVSQSLLRASVVCAVPLKVLWSRDYPRPTSAYQLCSWSSLYAGAGRKAGVELLHRFFIAQRDPWSRGYSQQISLRDDARTDFKAGNTQVKSAVFLDELVEICQLFCILFFNIFSNVIFFLKWK